MRPIKSKSVVALLTLLAGEVLLALTALAAATILPRESSLSTRLSSPQKPDDAFAAVPYRQEWYWIDDKDFPSKRLFSFIMFLFTLTDTGDKQGAPVITIPAG
jgi:hypothetical protein